MNEFNNVITKEVYENLRLSIKDTGECILDTLLNFINNKAKIKPNNKN